MQGLHLTSDLSGCDPGRAEMRDPEALARLCLAVVAEAGLTPVAQLFHAFLPQGAGITGVVLLAESHLAVHTWPEISAVTVDVYVCNFAVDNSAKARRVMDRLRVSFDPASAEEHQLERGRRLPRA